MPTEADLIFDAAFRVARAVVATRPQPRPIPAPPVDARTGMGMCARCLTTVRRSHPSQPWRSIVGVVNGRPTDCHSAVPPDTYRVLSEHPASRIELVSEDDERDDPDQCFCATTRPPCSWCCP